MPPSPIKNSLTKPDKGAVKTKKASKKMDEATKMNSKPDSDKLWCGECSSGNVVDFRCADCENEDFFFDR